MWIIRIIYLNSVPKDTFVYLLLYICIDLAQSRIPNALFFNLLKYANHINFNAQKWGSELNKPAVILF